MQIKNADGTPRDVRLMAPEIPDQVRVALGWALFHPALATVKPTGQHGNYRIHVEDRGEVSPDIPPDMMRALLLLRLLNPSPDNPREAVGNPEFLTENREWQRYIPDPMRLRRR